LTYVAYSSAEFMLSKALSIYSGGHSNVSGYQLKTISKMWRVLI
jgi:hypothetical protein